MKNRKRENPRHKTSRPFFLDIPSWFYVVPALVVASGLIATSCVSVSRPTVNIPEDFARASRTNQGEEALILTTWFRSNDSGKSDAYFLADPTIDHIAASADLGSLIPRLKTIFLFFIDNILIKSIDLLSVRVVLKNGSTIRIDGNGDKWEEPLSGRIGARWKKELDMLADDLDAIPYGVYVEKPESFWDLAISSHRRNSCETYEKDDDLSQFDAYGRTFWRNCFDIQLLKKFGKRSRQAVLQFVSEISVADGAETDIWRPWQGPDE